MRLHPTYGDIQLTHLRQKFLDPVSLYRIKNLIPPWVGATNNELDLNEKSWTVMKGQGHGHSPTTIQMIRLLSSLSGIYFRGGVYPTCILLVSTRPRRSR